MDNTKKLSLCIITHNRFVSVLKAVNSVKDIVDEVVIVDQSSSIDEANKLRNISDVYVKTTKKGYVEPDRNYCVSIASGEYILTLDSDEYIEPDQAQRIRTELLTIPADVYWFKFKNILIYKNKEYDLKPILGDDPHPRMHKKFILGRGNAPTPAVFYSDVCHRYPAINSMRQVFSELYITHERTLEDIVESHITRYNSGDEQSRNMEKRFLLSVFQLIGLSNNDINILKSKYDKLGSILK